MAVDRQQLEAAIGRNSGYYFRRFEQIDAGRKGGWNWPAFFFSTAWFSYRGLGGWATLNFIAPWAAFILGVLMGAAIGGLGMLIMLLAYLVGFYILVPMYADALYYKRIRRTIAHVAEGGKPSPPTWPIGASVVGLIMIGLPVVLAAISIPTFGDYTPRSQVGEAIALMGGAKTSLAEHFADKGKWPDNLKQVAETTSGQYTERVEIASGAGVASGALVMTATMKKNGVRWEVAGKTAQMRTEDGGKTWTCSRGAVNGVDNKYLPAACR